MSKSKKSGFAPKRCKGRKRGCRERKKNHLKCLCAGHKRLKVALNDKLKVLKVWWAFHYVFVLFADETQEKFYANFNYARWLLRSKMFYRPAPLVIVNLFHYSTLNEDTAEKTLVFSRKYAEKLINKDQKSIKQLRSLLLGNQVMQAARRFYK